MREALLSTKEAASAVGVTVRILQNWEEQCCVIPERVKPVGRGRYARGYRQMDVFQARICKQLRRKGLKLEAIRKVLAFVEAKARYYPGIRGGGTRTVLLIETSGRLQMGSKSNFMDFAKAVKGFYLVDLTECWKGAA